MRVIELLRQGSTTALTTRPSNRWLPLENRIEWVLYGKARPGKISQQQRKPSFSVLEDTAGHSAIGSWKEGLGRQDLWVKERKLFGLS